MPLARLHNMAGIAGAAAFASMPGAPPDRGRYFRAMFITLISDDGSLSDFQT